MAKKCIINGVEVRNPFLDISDEYIISVYGRQEGLSTKEEILEHIHNVNKKILLQRKGEMGDRQTE